VSFLSFTQAERRALITLAAFLSLGLAVRVIKARLAVETVGYRLIATAPAEPSATQPRVEARLSSGIDPNTAPQEDLELLPGIGPGLAARIISYRQAHGRFGTASDLLLVPGIGERLLARITPYLSFP
jgi:competence ComEA-like helix-hairpin-helix protein